jgi:hypothetical protein
MSTGFVLAALLPPLRRLRTLVLRSCLLPVAATTAILRALRPPPLEEGLAVARRER